MILTSAEIAQKKIVENGFDIERRATTYDATVGCIILGGCELAGESYTLPPRGMVWVVSAETFKLPADVTGLATLRTTWTHEGILALNVGIVDPGWDGPLAAALVNFSNANFPINKGDTFLRLLFHSHNVCSKTVTSMPVEKYKKEIMSKSRNFSESFLSMDKLVAEVTKEVFYFPKSVFYIAIAGTLLALIAMFSTMALDIWTDHRSNIAELEARIDVAEKSLEELNKNPSTEFRLKQLEDRLDRSWW